MRLEIEGQEADLGNNIIAITRRVKDLANPSLNYVDITNLINLPKTNKNQQIFKGADDISTTSDGLYKLYPSKIIDQDFLFNGVGFLKDVNSVYPFQLSDKSKELLSALNNKINLLPYDDQDFTFNSTSYNNLKLLDSDNNLWVWSITAQHIEKTLANTRFTSGDAGLKFSRPLFSFKKILDDLIEAQGWTIELDTDLVPKVGISSNAKQFYVTSYQKTLDLDLTLSGEQNLTNLNTNDFENNVTTASTTIQTGTTKTIFRLRGNVSTDAEATIKFISTSIGTSKEQTKEFKVKAGQKYIDFKTTEFEPSDSDTDISVEVKISGSGSFSFEDTLLYTIIEEQNLGNIEDNNLIGYRVKAFDNLPDYNQIDIFRDAIKLTNSIIVPDSLNKIIYLKTLNNLSKLNSKDWSKKFNSDKDSYKIVNKISGYAQVNNLIYNNDDTVNSDLGKETFTVANESLEDTADILQLNWGASDEVAIENFETLPVASFNIYNNTERENEINDRLVYIYDDSATPTYTLARFLNIDWRTLKANYYKNWLDSFNRIAIVEGEADLKKLDVTGHDFIQLVYISHFKSSFFVHVMDDYIPGLPTKVELFKFL